LSASGYNDIAADAKIVLKDASQVSTVEAASSSKIDFLAKQEVGGQSNGLSH
jgi:hypothetical protein